MFPKQESSSVVSSVTGWGRACFLVAFSFEMLAQGNFRERERNEPVQSCVVVNEMKWAPSSYLLIDFHRLFCVVEKEFFTWRSQVNIHLEAGVLREFPAVWTTAEGAVKCFCDGRIQQGALSLFGPHTTERQGELRTVPNVKGKEGVIAGIICQHLDLKKLPNL